MTVFNDLLGMLHSYNSHSCFILLGSLERNYRNFILRKLAGLRHVFKIKTFSAKMIRHGTNCFNLELDALDSLKTVNQSLLDRKYKNNHQHIIWCFESMTLSSTAEDDGDYIFKDLKGNEMSLTDIYKRSLEFSKYIDGYIWLVFDARGPYIIQGCKNKGLNLYEHTSDYQCILIKKKNYSLWSFDSISEKVIEDPIW